MDGPGRIEKKVQLLVEGNDQRNFFEAFARHLSLQDVQVRNFGGVTELRGFLSALVSMQGFPAVRSLGIVRDAEADAESALRSARSSLDNAGLPVPPGAGVRSGGTPAVSVLILPDGSRRGMLETLLCDTFADAPERACIDDYFACVRDLPSVSFGRADKARVHAWLATRPEPHVSVGVAAQKGYWDLDHFALAGVRAFLAAP